MMACLVLDPDGARQPAARRYRSRHRFHVAASGHAVASNRLGHSARLGGHRHPFLLVTALRRANIFGPEAIGIPPPVLAPSLHPGPTVRPATFQPGCLLLASAPRLRPGASRRSTGWPL